MKAFLSTHERENLVKQHKKERDKRICDRIKAVLLYDEGWTLMQIARVLLLSDDAVRKHIKEFKAERKLKPENGGSKEQLTKQQAEALVEHLEKYLYMFTKDIAHYVKHAFEVNYTIPGMHKWLYRHGFSYKKPTLVPGKADLQAQKSWIKDYEQLKVSLPVNETICFMDGVHPTHNSQAQYGWIKKGIRKELPSNTGRQRVNISGAIDLVHTRLHYQEDKLLTAETTVNFLKSIETAYPTMKKVHVFCDNAGYYRGKKLQVYLENSKIELHYLPPYSPNLNPIERLWKFLKDRVVYNLYYEKFMDFRNAVLGFLETVSNLNPLSKFGKELKSRIRDKFKPMGSLISDSSS